MTLQHGAVDKLPEPGHQSEARLTAVQLVADVNLTGVHYQLSVTMEGDANGWFDSSIQEVTWDSTPNGYAEAFHTVGTITCEAGALVCGVEGFPNGTPVKVDRVADQPMSPLHFLGVVASVGVTRSRSASDDH